mgnify:CR=1 FL=1
MADRPTAHRSCTVLTDHLQQLESKYKSLAQAERSKRQKLVVRRFQ